MKQEPQKSPFVFRPSREAIRHFKDASPEDKLNWLEEANRFVSEFVPQRILERWKKMTEK